MGFTITAEFPLGTYRGRHPDGTIDRIPSVARLHAALLCAAGFGPRATEHDGNLEPGLADLAALRWLEDNPPDAVSIPALQVNMSAATAYRNDGTISRTKQSAAIRKLGKPAGVSIAVDGVFRWTWSSPPSSEVREALEALCRDVAYLGTTESPVRLSTRDGVTSPVTHTLDADAGLFHTTAEAVTMPTVGRTQELVTAHTMLRGPVPSFSRDRTTGNEVSSAQMLPRERLDEARYVPAGQPAVVAPWATVLLLPLDVRIPDARKVQWATAAHRALIALIGDGAPALVTGVYPAQVRRPANRMGLHLLDPQHWLDGAATLAGDARTSALAILIPSGADDVDVDVLRVAADQLRTLRTPRSRDGHSSEQARVIGAISERSGHLFWPAPRPGMIRLWQTWPSAVPDTRGDGPEWTFTQAALLSLGFVWQGSDQVPRVSRVRGGQRDRALVDSVCQAQAAVLTTRAVHTTRPQDHVHRVHHHALVRPYRALLGVGSLGGHRAIQAIGQSRHLGGGLLVPQDVPEGTPLTEIGLPR